MGEMRKLTTVAVDNSMTREMAVQYAVWTWYQSDPGEKARDLSTGRCGDRAAPLYRE